MYNEEVKRKFLEEETTGNRVKRSLMTKIFNSLSSFEEETGLDLAEMNSSMIMSILSSSGIDEISTVQNYIIELRSYAMWCKNNNIIAKVQDWPSLEFWSVDISSSIRQNFFKNEVDLVNSIQAVHDLDSGYADAPVLALAWLGLTMKEVLALRDSDVDLEGRIIHLPDGNSINGFSDIIHDVLYRYSTCRVSSRDKGQMTREVIKDFSVDSYIKRMLSRGSKFFGKEYTEPQMRDQIMVLADKYEQCGFPRRHTFSNAWRSGRFYKLYQVEQSGVRVLDRSNKHIVENVFCHSKKYLDIIRTYPWYKKAFSLE